MAAMLRSEKTERKAECCRCLILMATIDFDLRPSLTPNLYRLLDGVRSGIRRYVWLQGTAAIVSYLGIAFWFTLAIDWFFEPLPLVRGLLLAAVIAGLIGVFFHTIGRRAFVFISNATAAAVLERRFPKFNDALLTAVTLVGREAASPLLLHDDDNDPASAEPGVLSAIMLARTCHQAAERAEGVNPQEVFNHRPLRRHGATALLMILSVMIFVLMFPGPFSVWCGRVLALSPEPWPRRTRLVVEGFTDGVRKAARGADLELVVKADRRMPLVPKTVEIRYRMEGGGRGRATMDRRGESRGSEDHYQEFAYLFKNVLVDVRFDILGGDDRIRGLLIRAVDSPTIGQMTLKCRLPDYIRRRQPPMPVTGVMQVPQGSHLTVLAADANKELVRVEVQKIIGDQKATCEVLEAQALAADRRGFEYELGILSVDTTLLFALTDIDGITGREPVRLVLVAAPDQPPQPAVQLDGVGMAITPQARLPIIGQISDDYGVGQVWFECAVEQRAQEPVNMLIAKLDDAPTVYHLKDKALEVRELGLKEGEKLALCVKAADLCALGRGPNVAAGERWLLEVVSPDQLRTMLEARELVLRQRFELILQEVTDTRDILARLPLETKLSSMDESKSISPASSDEPGDEADESRAADTLGRRKTLRLLGVQHALTNCRKNAQELLGVAEGFDDIRKQLMNNRIDTEELKHRLQNDISEPLHRIVEQMFPELERRLEALQKTLEDYERTPALRDRAQRQAEEIILAMRKVLDRMLELESFNEAVELLRSIVEEQDRLREKTQQRHKEKLRELLKEENK